jgi:hypothetical protein
VAKGFIIGFFAATILWGGLILAAREGIFDDWLGKEGNEPLPDAGAVAEATEPGDVSKGPRKGRRGSRRWGRRNRQKGGPSEVRGSGPIVESGDDLGEGSSRSVDVGEQGDEQQLSSQEIDAAFGPAMPGIRRCLLLLPPNQEGSGRVTFGLRISGSGRASAVRLHGPSALTTGDVGNCLRRAGNAIRFPAFDGPDMVVRYPITFE